MESLPKCRLWISVLRSHVSARVDWAKDRPKPFGRPNCIKFHTAVGGAGRICGVHHQDAQSGATVRPGVSYSRESLARLSLSRVVCGGVWTTRKGESLFVEESGFARGLFFLFFQHRSQRSPKDSSRVSRRRKTPFPRYSTSERLGLAGDGDEPGACGATSQRCQKKKNFSKKKKKKSVVSFSSSATAFRTSPF